VQRYNKQQQSNTPIYEQIYQVDVKPPYS